MEPVYAVTAELSPGTSVQEVSKVFLGLHALSRAGRIGFSIVPVRRDGPPRVVRLTVTDQKRRERALAIDLADQRDLFSIPDLEEVDLYFKRSLSTEALASLPEQLRAKIKPFGLNNPSSSLGATLRVLTARLRSGRDWRRLAVDARQLLALPSSRAFESPPDAAAEPAVFFQTRVWPPCDDDPAVASLNEARVAMVRTLRKAFGRRFRGGIVPSAFANEHFPDAVTQLPTRMRLYPHVMKRALVGVCSRGLHGSIPFKFSEYLAASRCIVAHEPEGVLPQPLTNGRHYLGFTEAEQCVAQCDRILTDTTAAREMRQRNWDYYRSTVEPPVQMLHVLSAAFPPQP